MSKHSELFIEMQEAEMWPDAKPTKIMKMGDELSLGLTPGTLMSKKELFSSIEDWIVSAPGDPLEKFVLLKRLKDMAEEGIKRIKPEAWNMIDTDGSEVSGMKIKTQTQTIWDYSGDSELEELIKTQKAIEADIKARQKLLKQSSELANLGEELVVSGEVIPPAKIKSHTKKIVTEY